MRTLVVQPCVTVVRLGLDEPGTLVQFCTLGRLLQYSTTVQFSSPACALPRRRTAKPNLFSRTNNQTRRKYTRHTSPLGLTSLIIYLLINDWGGGVAWFIKNKNVYVCKNKRWHIENSWQMSKLLERPLPWNVYVLYLSACHGFCLHDLGSLCMYRRTILALINHTWKDWILGISSWTLDELSGVKTYAKTDKPVWFRQNVCLNIITKISVKSRKFVEK